MRILQNMNMLLYMYQNIGHLILKVVERNLKYKAV